MIFTFYSFKGGVGRSLAMASVAHALAERGLRVLAVDFDLEAPGLERYFFDGEEARHRRAQRGLIDLVAAYREALTNEDAFRRAAFRDLAQFTQPVRDPVNARGGRLDLITAGRREPDSALREYALMVRSFDWQDFFNNWKGDRFFDWLQRQWTAPETGYDVVLIDSRTGVTEMGGVCAYQLADVAVLLCAPNYQNLEGTRDVVRDFVSGGVMALRHGRELEILALPARLADDHPKREQFLLDFERELGSEAMPAALALAGANLSYRTLALPYNESFAISERLVGEVPADDGGAYARLADALTLLARPGTRLHAQREEALARLKGQAAPSRDDAAGLIADTTRAHAGFDVFVAAAHADAAAAEPLTAALSDAGLVVARDDPADTVNPGAPWSEVLDASLRYSQAMLVCVGPHGASDWLFRLVARARELQRRIVPVLLPGAELRALQALGLADLMALDLRARPIPGAMPSLLASLRASSPLEAQAPPAEAAAMPYPGPRPYTEDEQKWFAGRDAELASLVALLADNDVVWLEGPAGAGKTSLVRAGLLPLLRRGEVAGILPEAIACIDLDDPAPFMPGPGFGFVVLDHDDTHRPLGGIPARPSDWLDAVRAPDKVLVVQRRAHDSAAARQTCERQQGAPRRAVLRLEPLAGEAFRQALELPARRAGVLFEPGLVERLVDSTGDALNRAFQVQLALQALWPAQRRGWLTNRALDDAGHLAGVFQRHLDATLAAWPETDREAARVLFRALAVLDSNQRLVPDTKPWALLSTIPALGERAAVLRDALARAGLIDLWFCTEPGIFGDPEAEAGVAVALVRPDPLQYLPNEGRIPDLEFFLWRGRLGLKLRAWRDGGRHEALLLGEAALREALGWRAERGAELTEPESTFIEQSSRAADWAAERADAARRAEIRSLRRRGLLMGSVAIVGLALAVFAGWSWRRADLVGREREVALRETVVLNAASEGQATLLKLRPGSDVRGLLQLAAARRMSNDARVASLVAEGLMAQPGLRAVHELPQAQGGAAAFGAGAGQLVYAAQGDRVGMIATGAAGGPVVARFAGPVAAAAESVRLALVHGGRELVVHDQKQGRVEVRQLEGGRVLASWGAQGGVSVRGLLAADGHVARLDDDSTLSVYQAGAWERPLWQRRGVIAALAINSGLPRLLAYDNERRLLLLDAATGVTLATRQETGPATRGFRPARPLGGAAAFAFSPDGSRLAAAGALGLQLYDERLEPAGEPIAAALGDVFLLAFSPDGRRVASYDADGVLQTFDLPSRRVIAKLSRGHAVTSMAFSADGQSLWTSGRDGTARRWDLRLDQPAGFVVDGLVGRTWALAWSGDGRAVYTGGEEGKIQRWDAAHDFAPAGAVVVGPAGKMQITAVAASADGASVAAGTADGSVLRWDARGAQLQPAGAWPRAHKGTVYGLAFAPDGSLLSGGTDSRLLRFGATGAPVETAAGGPVNSLAWLPSQGRIATGDTTRVRLWKLGPSLQPEGEPFEVKGSLPRVDTLAFRPDGAQVAVAVGSVLLVDPAARTVRSAGLQDVNSTWALAYDSGGTLLATGTSSGDIRLWRSASLEPATPAIRLPRGLRPLGDKSMGDLDMGATTSLAFSPDNRWLAVAGDAGMLWLMPHPDRWVEELCARAGRNLTQEEWKRWISAALPYVEQCPGLPRP